MNFVELLPSSSILGQKLLSRAGANVPTYRTFIREPGLPRAVNMLSLISSPSCGFQAAGSSQIINREFMPKPSEARPDSLVVH